MASTAAGGRGRRAERPGQIPRRGWRDILLRTKDEIGNDHVSITAAGVAFYALLALFPAIAATVQDGVFVIGTLDFVKHLLDTTPDASLAKTPAYERAIAAAGGDGISDMYVDIAGIVSGAETMIPASEKATWETEVKPFLAPFEAFATIAEKPGATAVSRAVITFVK